jgi:hypothetical protein
VFGPVSARHLRERPRVPSLLRGLVRCAAPLTWVPSPSPPAPSPVLAPPCVPLARVQGCTRELFDCDVGCLAPVHECTRAPCVPHLLLRAAVCAAVCDVYVTPPPPSPTPAGSAACGARRPPSARTCARRASRVPRGPPPPRRARPAWRFPLAARRAWPETRPRCRFTRGLPSSQTSVAFVHRPIS